MLQESSSFIENVELYGEFPLISEAPYGSSYAGTAFTEIFGEGNSFESIFELKLCGFGDARESLDERVLWGIQ